MTEREGVIKYSLDFRPGPVEPVADELLGWRAVLHRLGLVGEEAERYHGLGFGNVSIRIPNSEQFIVSGTQTGRYERLGPEHFCRVTACDPKSNWLQAQGPVAPSSEALTHAAVYAANMTIGCVLHGHSPELWQRGEALGLAATAANIEYGTPAMAAEVQRLLAVSGDSGVLIMAGHEDGVLSFGSTADAAGAALVTALARALTVR